MMEQMTTKYQNTLLIARQKRKDTWKAAEGEEQEEEEEDEDEEEEGVRDRMETEGRKGRINRRGEEK